MQYQAVPGSTRQYQAVVALILLTAASCNQHVPDEKEDQFAVGEMGAALVEEAEPAAGRKGDQVPGSVGKAMRALQAERAQTRADVLASLGKLTLGDGTEMDAKAAAEERAALTDRIDELKEQMSSASDDEHARLEAEYGELWPRLLNLSEGLAVPRSAPPVERLEAEKLPPPAQLAPEERERRMQDVWRKIDPADPSRQAEYQAAKSEALQP